MDLNFTQQPEGWVAEFELTADANLHIERDERGYMEVLQRSPEGGQYARVEGLDAYAFDLVNDLDLTAIIYPKYIKVVSAVLPTYAVVTSAGEVTEIKSQTKEIEVTANGTTEVTPDTGFSYLNSVKVKTNVPTSGEGGGSASTMEYLVLSATDNFMAGLVVTNFSAFARIYEEGTVVILPTYALIADGALIPQVNLPIAIAIDFSAKAISGELMTIKDLIIANGVTADQLAAIPRITEGEFYSLDGPEV